MACERDDATPMDFCEATLHIQENIKVEVTNVYLQLTNDKPATNNDIIEIPNESSFKLEDANKLSKDVEVITIRNHQETRQHEEKATTKIEVLEKTVCVQEQMQLSVQKQMVDLLQPRAWGCIKNQEHIFDNLEEDKEVLNRKLGLTDQVKSSAIEFVCVNNVKRKRGRPPKKPEIEGGIFKIQKEENTEIKTKPQPSKEEVQAYLNDLKAQIDAENVGGKKSRGRPRKFDLTHTVYKKTNKQEASNSDVVLQRSMNTVLLNSSQNVPKRRGRPPILNKPVKVPKRLGRPPKPRSLEDLLPKVPKKRGRPLKPKTAEDLLPKIPKKRGRPPKPKLPVAIEELGVPVIFGNQNETVQDEKGKMIYNTYNDNSQNNGNKQCGILEMISSGMLVVDVSDSANLPKRRGRPPIDPDNPRPQPVPKPPKAPQLSAAGKILGRPKKGEERQKQIKEKKRRGRPKKPIVETENKEPKKRGRPRKENSMYETPKQKAIDIKKMTILAAKYKNRNYMPGYKARLIYNCCWCREWSWDIKVCSYCFRAVPPECQLMNIEEHEVIDNNLDITRPYFHPPPVPYIKPGLVVLCSGCFYYSSKHDICEECGCQLSNDSTGVQIEFLPPDCIPTSDIDNKIIKFEPRLVEDKWLECPHCGLTTNRTELCCHCNSLISKMCSIINIGSNKNIIEYPTEEMLESGRIEEFLPNYVPLFKENRIAMCRWCCTWVWDFNRCRKCFRKLPGNSDLMIDGPDYDYVDGKAAVRPTFSELPVPYLRPGLMMICSSCNNFSKNFKYCDGCKKKLVNCDIVNVSFKIIDPSQPLANGEIKLPFNVRKVNFVYAVCPHCEFSTPDVDQCTLCGKLIPEFVYIKSAVLPSKKVAAVTYKQQSIFPSSETILARPIVEYTKNRLSSDYVPRFREYGIAQCRTCFAWTWDFNSCTQCFAPVQNSLTLPLVVYNTHCLRDKNIQTLKPKFAPSPLPYLRPGRVVICKSCLSCTRGPPVCTECGDLIEMDAPFVFVNFEWNPTQQKPSNSEIFTYTPRTTANKNLCICPFCSFTTENFDTCSFCCKIIPKSCLIVPQCKNFDFKFIMDSIKVKPVIVNIETQTVKCEASTAVSPTQMSQEKSVPVVNKKSNIVLKKSILTATHNLDVPKQSNIPAKVLALKPVPPPEVPPKNIIKINVNTKPQSTKPHNIITKPRNTTISKFNSLPDISPNLPEQIILPKFNEVPSQSSEKGGKLASYLDNAYSKLQSSLKAAGLIGENFVTSTPSKPGSSAEEREKAQQIATLHMLSLSPIESSRLNKM